MAPNTSHPVSATRLASLHFDQHRGYLAGAFSPTITDVAQRRPSLLQPRRTGNMMLWRLRLRSASHVAPTACTPTCTTCWSTIRLSLGSMESPRDSAKSHPKFNCFDAGRGTGRHAAAFAARGYLLTLVDASPELLALAKRRCPSAPAHLEDLCTTTTSTRHDAVTGRGVLNDAGWGAAIRRSSSCGATPGMSSSRSQTTKFRSLASWPQYLGKA